MRIALTDDFTELDVQEGTLQNTSRLAKIEISTSTVKDTGITLNPGDIIQFKTDDTVYARAVWSNPTPTETVWLAHEPFKREGEGGGADVEVFTGATSTTNGKKGLVPRPMAGEQNKVLKGDGTWAEEAAAAVMTGATALAPGKRGLVPDPAAGDDEKFLSGDATWKSIAVMTGASSLSAGKKGLVPIPAAGDNEKYLKGDGTWKEISVMTGASSMSAGKEGLVPTPAAGDNNKFLRGDGTWEPIAVMTGASSMSAGEKGLVPKPLVGDNIKFLSGDGTWKSLPAMTGASALAPGKDGLVPIPAAGDQDKFLRGDGSWGEVGSVSVMTGATAAQDGKTGLAPKPLAGQMDFVLNGDGTWKLPRLYRKNSTVYQYGDIAVSPNLPSYLVLKCTTAGKTAATEPSFSGATEGDTVTDGTVIWTYQKLLHDSVPLGSILPYSANAQTPPHGFLYCEGQAVSRTMYADLFALIGTTYGAGDGSTTFNLPNMLDRYPEGATTAGTVKSAGLPNITGSIMEQAKTSSGHAVSPVTNYSGALTPSNNGPLSFSNFTVSGGGSENYGYGISIDASKSNSIYGNSTTVTPPTLTVRWIIKAYDAPTPSSAQIDLSQYASDLAARLTREQTPAFNRRDVITTSGTYTAPVTGWYKITAKGGGGGGAGGYYSSNGSFGGRGGGEGGLTIAWEHLDAGDTVSVVIGAGGTGGAAGNNDGSAGGTTTVTANNHTYSAGGGLSPSTGGTGTIYGTPGGTGDKTTTNLNGLGGAGGGNGGGSPTSTTGGSGTQGGGGAGGSAQQSISSQYAGGKGGNGYAWFEYFDPSL